ncbi:GAF domain-containing sensor histidine kinase [Euhalothece natronophila Z-M001]|uniref:histidine kinase n=1 Tax=Euhalothece natronophila Z-M001 TaxID=522448 RepID=A0A5B8NMW4_9CHRO|nr:GAF domain-containing sensor histidine kinase [Euhalothece natronophila]QDZ39459.1 GAF domain-containing sensor histidine kinase [Euhalothece natronophila Z-M001]
MELNLIRQEINELTLVSKDPNTLIQTLLEIISQRLQIQVGLWIPLENFPNVSYDTLNLLDSSQLASLEESIKIILLSNSSSEPEKKRSVLAYLQENFDLPYWEICPISAVDSQGWLILGSKWNLGWNHQLEETLATPFCLAIKTAKLQYQTQKNERYKRLQQQVIEVIHNSQDLETILQSAIADTAQALNVTRGVVFMLRYSEPTFSSRRQFSNPDITVQGLTQWAQTSELETELTSFPLTESANFLQAWQQAPTPLSLISLSNQSTEPSCLKMPYSMPSWLITPLMGTSRGNPDSQMVLGLLLLQNQTIRKWQQEEQEIVSWVSTQASTAIIHNKTLQRVQSLVDERTSQLQRSLDVQAKLYETSRHQVQQLEELNQLKDDFLATISHELNTPLATMKMAIQMLQKPELSPERQRVYLNILDQEWQREHNLIKDLLTLQKIDNEGLSLQVQSIYLKELLTSLGEEMTTKWQRKNLGFILNDETNLAEEEVLQLYSDLESVRRVFAELMNNAGKYSSEQTTVEVVISQSDYHWIMISVSNIGHGISPAEQGYIFERFRRGKGATQKAIPGTGLGLALVKSLVEHLHGTIDVDSEYSADGLGKTTFYVTLPKSLNNV